jgi:Na+(H+)/acetate symporter ActP
LIAAVAFATILAVVAGLTLTSASSGWPSRRSG